MLIWAMCSLTPNLSMDQVIQVLPGVIVLDFGSPQPSGLLKGHIVREFFPGHLHKSSPMVPPIRLLYERFLTTYSKL